MSSYQLSTDDTTVAVVASAEAVTVKTSTSKIPEAQGLTWTDSYFETSNTNGVIAVFDINYDLVRWRLRFSQVMMIFSAIFYCGAMALPSFLEGNSYGGNCYGMFAALFFMAVYGTIVCQINKQFKGINGIHLAVTEEGIHIVANGFPLGSMFRTTTVVRFVWLCVGAVRLLWKAGKPVNGA
jgi:hypothetical protein